MATSKLIMIASVLISMLVLYVEPVLSNCLDECLRQHCNGIAPASKDACAKNCGTSCLNVAAVVSPGPASRVTINIKTPDAEITDVDVKNVSRDGDTANVKSQIAVTNPYDQPLIFRATQNWYYPGHYTLIKSPSYSILRAQAQKVKLTNGQFMFHTNLLVGDLSCSMANSCIHPDAIHVSN